MENWQTGNGINIIRVLSGRSNVYLILKDGIAILVDTSISSAYITLSKNIRSLNLTIEDISYLILTHTHFDHCQSAKRIKETGNCKICSIE